MPAACAMKPRMEQDGSILRREQGTLDSGTAPLAMSQFSSSGRARSAVPELKKFSSKDARIVHSPSVRTAVF